MCIRDSIWSKDIQKLNMINTKQQFVEEYQNLYINSLSSSYLNWKKYEKIDIYIWSWFYYLVDDTQRNILNSSDLYYTWISIDWNVVDNLEISLFPYNLKCSLCSLKNWYVTTWNSTKFKVSHKDWKRYWCFKISNYNCRLIEYICD